MAEYYAVFRSGEVIRTQKLGLSDRFSVDDLEWEGVGGRSVLKVGESLLWGDHMIALFHEDDIPGKEARHGEHPPTQPAGPGG